MLDDYDAEPVRFIRFPLPCADGMCWGVDCRSGSRLCDRNREPEEEMNEQPKTRCHDCAFSKGTLANSQEQTTVRAMLCVLSHEPFGCHVNGGLCVGYVEACQSFGPSKPNTLTQVVSEVFEACYQLALKEDRAAMTPAELARAEALDRGERTLSSASYAPAKEPGPFEESVNP